MSLLRPAPLPPPMRTASHVSSGRRRAVRGLGQRVNRLLQHPRTELFVGGLIITSVALTVMELSVEPTAAALALLERLNNVLTAIFAAELLVRFVAAPSKRRFIGEFWLDILAVLIPLTALSVVSPRGPLRILRILRLAGLLSRVAGLYHYVVRRAALELLIASGLVLLTVVSGSAALLTFEKQGTSGIRSYSEAFWVSLYSLFAGEPVPSVPGTFGGKIVITIIMFMGMSTFAMFTGTVSVFMMNRLRSRGDFVDPSDLRDHLVICGWNRKAEIIAREWVIQRNRDDPSVVVIGELDGEAILSDASLRRTIVFIDDDFTKVSALEKAGVRTAETCVFLSDTGKGRTLHDADARTILAALTVERLNPAVYTCAELNNEEYSPHLVIANVNDFVVTGEHNAYLLAQATLNCGLTAVFSELLTHRRGNSFYRLDLGDAWTGKTFFERLHFLKEKHDAILIAVRTAKGEVHVNPRSYTFEGGEQIVLIAEKEPDLR